MCCQGVLELCTLPTHGRNECLGTLILIMISWFERDNVNELGFSGILSQSDSCDDDDAAAAALASQIFKINFS